MINLKSIHPLNAYESVAFLTTHPDALILDFRDKEYFELEHFPNAIFLKLEELDTFIETADKSKLYLVHCGAGVRSPQASKILAAASFQNIYCATQGYRKIKEAMTDK
jgi:rhodanese-related sulfurtransferase